MTTRYYIRRDRLNGSGLMVTLYWNGKMFSAIDAKSFVKASAALKCSARLINQVKAFGNELTICATDY